MPMPNIGHFVPPNLKRDFYHGVKGNKRTRHNGLDPYGWSIDKLLLYLPLWALRDSAFKSVDAYKHLAIPAGTTKFWTPQGWDLAGADESISLPADIFSQTLFAGGITLMAWVKFNSLDAVRQQIINIEGRCNLELGGGADVMGFSIYDGASQSVVATDVGALSTGTFYHIAGTWDTTTMKIYMDTVLETATDTATIPLIDAVSRTTVLGATYSGSEFMDGIIGEVWVYGRALPVGEITRTRNSTLWRYQ